MSEGYTVPESAIPGGAWGFSARMLTPEETAAADPFGGTGVRLRVPPIRVLTNAEVTAVTGLERSTVSAKAIWADAETLEIAAREGVERRWEAWLATLCLPPAGSALGTPQLRGMR